MDTPLTPEQQRQVKAIANEEAEAVFRHSMANLNIGTAEGEPRQTTQRNIWDLWEIAADWRSPAARAVRKWVFDRYTEWDTPEQKKIREHLTTSMQKSEKMRENWSKVFWGILGALGIAAAMVLLSKLGINLGGK